MKKIFTIVSTAFITMALFTACGTTSQVPVDDDNDDYETGLFSISEEENTNAISKVKTGNDISAYRSLKDYLVGRVAGLEMTSDGRLNIRGARSVTGELMEPLVVVDGVKVFSIDSINPSDVYSVDVLKDASASMYGIEGEGGVIVITTKGAQYVKQGSKEKGKKKNKPTVTVEASSSFGTSGRRN